MGGIGGYLSLPYTADSGLRVVEYFTLSDAIRQNGWSSPYEN